jgi:RAT1-interacting protein
MLCSLYNHQEPWKVAATLYNGTIYLQEIETEEKRRQEAAMPPQQRAACYWGLKFEDYVTSKDPPPKAPLPQSPTLPRMVPGTVNPHRAYSSVVRTRMNTHSIVMVGEVDCCDYNSKEKSPQNYIELKTSRIILTDRNKASFRRHKLMKWWVQSFLVGVPKLICGFRNDDGIVKSLQTFKIADIPKETQVDLTMWQPSVCLNFLDELLVWIRKTVTQDNPKVVCVLEWNAPYTCVTCHEYPPDSEHVFLPDWYINKRPPSPSSVSTS